ncbi:helix-turn-helix domain-containing protein [Bacillus timonensis]|nr:helix-turn-helix domain-containing protein [Bacillus timonensis]
MKITAELANPIIHKLKGLLEYNMNVMDAEGIIVASSDESRVHQVHKGAMQVIKTQKEIVISPDDVKNYHGTKPGVNLPIEFLGEMIGVVGVTGNPKELYKFTQVIKVTVETMLQQMYMMNQVQYQTKLMENWIIELIHPDGFNRERLESNAKHIFQWNVNKQEVFVLLLQVKEFQSTSHMLEINEKKQQMMSDIRRIVEEVSFSAYVEDGYYLFGINRKGRSERVIGEVIEKYLTSSGYSFQIGIGNIYTGVEGYRKSYFEGKQSISLLERLSLPYKVVHIGDLGVYSLLDYIPSTVQKEFVEKYYSNERKLGEELRTTLEVFFESELSMKKSAEKLHIHRNTLMYRLDQIENELGLDPRKFSDAIKLKLILLFEKLTG